MALYFECRINKTHSFRRFNFGDFAHWVTPKRLHRELIFISVRYDVI